MQPKHGIEDTAKYEGLRDVFVAADGWPDSVPPVLAIGDHAVTGSHRIAAARAAGLVDAEIRRIDLLAEGIDLAALGYDHDDLLWADDYDIARILREAGRPDLADLAIPS